MNSIQLSDHFSYGRLLRFTLPSILMMIFTSVYSIVDGFFVSNFVGKTPFATVSFIMPFLMILGALGFMFGTGGSALIAATMGAGHHDKAMRLFSLFVYATLGCGVALAAAAATALSQFVGSFVPLLYFFRPNTSLLQLTATRFDGRALCRACANGSSELMSNISMSLVSMLYNAQLMRFAGEDGVLMYVNMIFMAAFLGYSVGTAPIASFHFGAQNHTELRSLLNKSLVIIGAFSLLLFLLAEKTGGPLARLFVGYDTSLLELTRHGFLIYSFSFIFAGIAIYGSSFFTALNNGLISALISFLFQVAAVLIVPLLWGLDGIRLSIVAADLMR